MKLPNGNLQILTERQGPDLVTRTAGLKTLGQREVMAQVHDESLIKEIEEFLRVVLEYVIKCGASLEPEQTLSYGYWLTKFRDGGQGLLETWEYNSAGTDFIKGVTLTLTYWRDQHFICDRYKSKFDAPLADQLTVVSKGVFEGLPVQGVRYPSPEHMSGWWITTDEYNGDVSTLQREHTYHVTAARPELAKYLGLQPGFRFDLSKFEDVWYENEILTS